MNSDDSMLDRPLIPGMRAPLTLGQLQRILRARWRLIAAVVATFLLLAVLSILLLSDSYAAKVSLLIEFPGDDPVTGQQYPSNLADSYQATQVDLLSSYKVRLAVVDELKLADDTAARQKFEDSAPAGASFEEWLAQRIAKKLTVAADQSSRLLVVQYEDKDPQKSAKIANSIVEQYMGASAQIASDPAKNRQSRYAEFLDGLRGKVDAAQDRLTDIQQRLQVINGNNAGNIDTQRLEDLGLKLNQAESDHQAARAKVEQIRALQKAGQPVTAQAEILGSSYVQELKGRLLRLQSERADVGKVLGSRHPKMRSLNAEIGTVRARLSEEINAYLQANRGQAQTTADQQTALRKTFDQERADVIDQQRKRAEVAKYQRELASAKQVYDAALNEYDQVLGGSEMHRQNISVISWASPPRAPSGLGKKIKLLLALVLGAIVGCALALLLEFTDRRVRGPEDITREMDLPILGDLPGLPS
ncbi:Wzz/FepE/Etk N-terminal domain-containing protein [Salinisphaera aquimarina]|uniref:Wzz/FepE/Etk N-terminal domain-containing protein n=1 Tax=Salinisphaera aquimarina TaxID=2094031 RepID=A0ABV7EU21_9GAMM